MNIHHIGYAVKSIEKSKHEFLNMGYREEGSITHDDIREIDILFLVNGEYRIELVEPSSENAPIYNTLKKMGNTPYHICYCCENIEEQVEILEQQGYLTTSEILPAVAISGRKVCFLYKRNVGVIELVEGLEA